LVAYAGEAAAVSPAAYHIFSVGDLPITNSMVMSWLVSIALIFIIRWMVGQPKLLPSRGQALIEVLIENLKNVVEPIVGRHMVGPTFPILLSFFLFILIHNWSSLLPGVGTFGRFENGHLLYFLRPANADLNGTLALACVAMASWFYFVLRYAGIKTLIYDLFGNKAEKKDIPGAIYYLLFIPFLAVGLIEVVSIVFRPVSLSLRLYGNVFGGENLLTSVSGLFAWVLPLPFYFLEFLIGFVQAFVFMLLVCVYIGSICNHGDHASDH